MVAVTAAIFNLLFDLALGHRMGRMSRPMLSLLWGKKKGGTGSEAYLDASELGAESSSEDSALQGSCSLSISSD